jgi:hypothetical protein
MRERAHISKMLQPDVIQVCDSSHAMLATITYLDNPMGRKKSFIRTRAKLFIFPYLAPIKKVDPHINAPNANGVKSLVSTVPTDIKIGEMSALRIGGTYDHV